MGKKIVLDEIVYKGKYDDEVAGFKYGYAVAKQDELIKNNPNKYEKNKEEDVNLDGRTSLIGFEEGHDFYHNKDGRTLDNAAKDFKIEYQKQLDQEKNINQEIEIKGNLLPKNESLNSSRSLSKEINSSTLKDNITSGSQKLTTLKDIDSQSKENSIVDGFQKMAEESIKNLKDFKAEVGNINSISDFQKLASEKLAALANNKESEITTEIEQKNKLGI